MSWKCKNVDQIQKIISDYTNEPMLNYLNNIIFLVLMKLAA